MLSRALSLATVMLLIGGFAAIPVQAQNLEAGKSPSQIFAGTCNACHKSPRGLLKTVSPGSLPGFLRQHYTTSSEMASLLSAFLVSNGASDTRYVGSQPPKLGKDGKPEAKPPSGSPEQLDRFGRRMRPPAPVQEDATRPDTAPPPLAARPDADGISPQAETGRQGRNGRRKPGEPPDATKPAVDGQPAQAASERGPDGRRLSAKQRLSKRGKPGSEEPPKTDAAKDEPATGEPAKDDKSKSETAKDEGSKPEGVKPSGESKPETAKSDAKPESKPDSAKSESAKSESAKSESAKSEPAKPEAPKAPGSGDAPALRADPVPAVTPAPKSAEGETRPPQVATPAPSSPPAAVAVAPPAVTASAPPPAPMAPAGPPAPPISQ